MVADRSDAARAVREQTREEQAVETLRRIHHLVSRPEGMTRAEIIAEVKRTTGPFLRP